MGAFKAAIITDNGNAMIANAVADIKTIRFSKVVVSSHEYPEDTVWSGLTTLDGIQQETTPTDVRISGTSQVGLRALFTNANVSEKYKIQMIGIYATDGDREVLFAISKALQADEMPAYVGAAPSSFIYNISLIVSRASAIQTTVDPAGTATVQDILALEEGISGLRVKVEKVYHNIIVTVPTSWTGSMAPYMQELTVPEISSISGSGSSEKSAVISVTTEVCRIIVRFSARYLLIFSMTNAQAFPSCRTMSPIMALSIPRFMIAPR